MNESGIKNESITKTPLRYDKFVKALLVGKVIDKIINRKIAILGLIAQKIPVIKNNANNK
jgi:hypothetical protein|tara:strand:- start:797 stop:976 length:180 start_codon:yes stop_codon:yes gene_type:complete